MQDYSFHQRTAQSGLLSCNTGPVWEEGAGGGGRNGGRLIMYARGGRTTEYIQGKYGGFIPHKYDFYLKYGNRYQ